MRIVLAAAFVAGFGGFANAQNEANKDRPGSDISVQNIGNNANLCRQNCDAIAACRAWTFVKPGIQGPSARCYLKSAVPAQVNNNCCTSGVKLSGPVPAGAGVGKDRPGANLSVTNMASPNPTLCKNACDGNANCDAWTFVKPGIQGPQARCWLKSAVPAEVNNSCCISGVKLPPPVAIPPGAQNNRDRPGSNFANFNLPAPAPALCRDACMGQAQCRAWTYVKPGIQGPSARCWLKNATPAAINNNCCVSGVKPNVAVPANADAGKNRPGADYNVSNVANPTLCRNACDGQANCQAWSWAYPTVEAASGRCHLKNAAPASVNAVGYISGVKPPAAIPPGAQNNRDRPGSNFANFNLPAANPALCRDACMGQANCRAWTYVKPGIQGPSARCWLKNPTPAAVNNNCCVSGVKPNVAVPADAEAGKNRPGSDYNVSNVANPTICKNACDGQANCQAWAWAYPTVEAASGRCHLKNAVPAAVNAVGYISGAKLADPVPPGANNNRNRPGNTFSNFIPVAPDANLCMDACDANPNCMAWTYVRPGNPGPSPRCHLKNPTPPQVVDTCCISGVKAAPPPGPQGPFEVGVNRPGFDIVDFGGAANSALLCFGACAIHPQCKAWTFVNPGFQGPLARCWLKNDVPPPVADACCTSGVKP
jgi:hypothetical protein